MCVLRFLHLQSTSTMSQPTISDNSDATDAASSTPDTFLDRIGTEVAAGMNALPQRMLVSFFLMFLTMLSNEFNFWTGYIANIAQLTWASFIRASFLSIEVLRINVLELINLMVNRGGNYREKLKEIFITIYKIFQGALQSTINVIKRPVQLPTEADYIHEDRLD